MCKKRTIPGSWYCLEHSILVRKIAAKPEHQYGKSNHPPGPEKLQRPHGAYGTRQSNLKRCNTCGAVSHVDTGPCPFCASL